MTVLSKNKDVPHKEGRIESMPVEDNAHIYKGAMVCDNEAGYIQPAADTIGFRLAGIAYEECDNTLTGHTQGGKYCRVYRDGMFKVVATSITQAMVGQMMYVVDDATVDDVSTNFIEAGILVQAESTAIAWIDIGRRPIEASPKSNLGVMVIKTDSYAVTVEDSGKVFAIATDAKIFTLPSTAAGLVYTFVNTGADGAVLLSVSPAALDKISGGGIAGGADNKDYQNTKATAKKYDLLKIVGDGADGWIVLEIVGTWVAEA